MLRGGGCRISRKFFYVTLEWPHRYTLAATTLWDRSLPCSVHSSRWSRKFRQILERDASDSLAFLTTFLNMAHQMSVKSGFFKDVLSMIWIEQSVSFAVVIKV